MASCFPYIQIGVLWYPLPTNHLCIFVAAFYGTLIAPTFCSGAENVTFLCYLEQNLDYNLHLKGANWDEFSD